MRNKLGEGWWDPRAAQKEALSFSITAVATTTVLMLPLSRARGQCKADAKCIGLCVCVWRGGDKDSGNVKGRWKRESKNRTKRLCGEPSV